MDIGLVCDDAGTNQGLFMHPDLWRRLIKPRMKRIYSVYKNAGCFTALHCCGRVMEILDDLLDLEIDILNPLHPLVHDGTPDEVHELTRQILQQLAREGEYLADTDQGLPFPAENIAAMRDAVTRWGKYPVAC